MDLSWPHNPLDITSWTNESLHIPTSAYMDDTVWLDSSKCRIQDTVNLAQEFFTMWDIKINTNKCELLVINPSVPKDQRFLTMGNNQNNTINATSKEIRYLDVWFSSARNTKRLTIKRICNIC